MITKFKKPVAASGSTIENEPIIKSDGASSDVMQWLSNDESSNITISEDDSNNLDLVVSAGNVGIGADTNFTYSNLEVKAASNVTGIGITSDNTNTDARNWGFITNNSAWGSLDIMYSSARNTTPYNTSALSISSAGKSTFAGDVEVSDGNVEVFNEKALWLYSTPTSANYELFSLDKPDAANARLRVYKSGSGTNRGIDFETGGSTRLTISSAGVLTLGPTDAVIDAGTDNGSDTHSIRIDAGATSSTRGAYAQFCGNQHASLAGKLVLQTGNSAEASTAGVYIRKDGGVDSIIAPATGGIYEVGGVLKENLLTNSGFDVWSNSTLENATGTNLVTGWTNGSGGDAYETFTTSSENITSAINSSGNAIAYFDISGLTTGKLYEISLTLTLNSGTGPALGTASAVASGAQQVGPQFVAGANSWVWEQGDDDNYIWLKSGLDTSAVGNWSAASVTLKEVTPGCVAADTLAPDGWYKTATSDMWRQHNDGGTYTKDGSFYAAKVTTTASWAGLNWPHSSTLWDSDEWTQRFAGRTVTYGAWLKTSVASFARLIINDSGSQTVSTNHTGGGAWEWIEVTATIGASPTSVLFQVGDTSPTGTYYISQPMLVFGSAIGSGNYSRPMGEIVMFEKLVNSTGYFTTGFSDVSGTLNVEADSNGCVPKGANGLFLDLGAQDSGSAGTDTFFRCGASASLGFVYANTYGLANDALLRNSTALCKCDSNGDIEARVEASGSGTFDAYLQYAGVQLR